MTSDWSRSRASFVAFAVFCSLLAVGFPERAAQATHDTSDPTPSGANCEWYGSAVETHDTRVDRETGSWQINHNQNIGWSTPSSDGTCRGSVHAKFRMDAYDGSCYYGEFDDTVPAHYEAYWNSSGGFSVGFFGEEQVLYEEGWGTCSGVTSSRMESVGASANCEVPGVTTDAQKQALQAVVVHCTQHYSDTSDGQTTSDTWHWTIRMRRTQCDTSVDSDHDDLADCTEYGLGTETHNPDTDGDGLTDGAEVLTHGTDPRKSDTDGGGIPDGTEIGAGTDPKDPSDDGPNPSPSPTPTPTPTPDAECSTAVFSSYDAFRARLEGYDEPRLHFDVATDWCLSEDDSVLVQDVTPRGVTLQSPLEFAIDAAVREVFSFHDVWRDPTSTISGGVVTSSGNWKHCFGIPLIGGKIRWVMKTPKAFRYAADVLRRVDGRFEDTARKMARLMDKAADALEWAIKNGSRAAKAAARKAIDLFGDLVYSLGENVQVKVFLLIVGVVADYSSSAPWAKDYLKDLAKETISGLIPKPGLLERFLSDELVCFSGWKPRIVQSLGTPGAVSGEFVDRDGDYEHWIVARHEGAF